MPLERTDVRDIDLFSGALSETRLEGAELGATFACGVARQFRLLKYGDRFYYEHANQSGSFSDGESFRLVSKLRRSHAVAF
ncbi:hypothetical protein HPB50_015254 [Hyalomma asiaticum]|uniref:Uncharacterized protein n=1 Tax=Hyalomma asiaticum TaxID=266040 RepID=A0ACB7RKY9_HYAAI|nr:hypothetical protein HPB50_015254 [Hyalomma asiaticum]